MQSGLTACSSTRVKRGLACAAFEKGIEGRADGGLVGDAELGQVVEGGVVVINWFVGVFKVEGGHVVGWARARV